jgi:hypothetical protein
MTVSGAWSLYRRARPPKPPRLGRWQRVLADPLTRTTRLVSGQVSLIISVEPPGGLSSPLHDERPTAWPCWASAACSMYRAAMGRPMQATATIWYWRSRM